MPDIGIGGGDRLSAALEDIARKLAGSPHVNIGFLEGATYPDGTGVAEVAAYQEFGTTTIPPRPFFRRMIVEKQAEWGPATANLLRQKDYDITGTLGALGAAVAGQLQQSIRDLTDPPLAPSTIARKGFAKPLIDTGTMLRAVDHEVIA